MKNRKLIRTLKKERRKLYPHGCPIQPRGCGKTYSYLAHFLRYIAFDVVIEIYKKTDREVPLEEAYKDMNNFRNKMWAIYIQNDERSCENCGRLDGWNGCGEYVEDCMQDYDAYSNWIPKDD